MTTPAYRQPPDARTVGEEWTGPADGSGLSASTGTSTTEDLPGVDSDVQRLILETGIPQAIMASPLHRLYVKRISQGRDLRVIISADSSATGVGKTTLAVLLALLWDPHGWDPVKGTLDPREFVYLYDQVRMGSVLLLDEAEQAVDKRRSQSNEALAVGHAFATKRYRQIPGILTLPSKDMMDARISEKLCDVWVVVREPGEADVYVFDENVHTGKVYHKKIATIEWPPLDEHPGFEAIEQKKHEWMSGEAQSKFVTREEFEEAKDNFWNKATAKRTYELVNRVYEAHQDPDSNTHMTQAEIGDAVGMGQANVSKIVNSDGFTDFYKSFDTDATA